jgi:hypothetical protein
LGLDAGGNKLALHERLCGHLQLNPAEHQAIQGRRGHEEPNRAQDDGQAAVVLPAGEPDHNWTVAQIKQLFAINGFAVPDSPSPAVLLRRFKARVVSSLSHSVSGEWVWSLGASPGGWSVR